MSNAWTQDFLYAPIHLFHGHIDTALTTIKWGIDAVTKSSLADKCSTPPKISEWCCRRSKIIIE